MQISFYVLGDRFQQTEPTPETAASTTTESTVSALNAGAVLNFVCKLTDTVLRKSEHSLVIVDDDIERLQRLDAYLWEYEADSFIPHNLITTTSQQASVLSTSLTAPVTLIPTLPEGFDGVVLNLAAQALPLANNDCLPERVLEIITPDDVSKQQGRDRYRLYRDMGFELIHYPIH